MTGVENGDMSIVWNIKRTAQSEDLRCSLKAGVTEKLPRLGNLLFKLVVEHNMTNHLLGGDIDMTRDEYNKMRGNSVREVAGTHGSISFRDVLQFHREE